MEIGNYSTKPGTLESEEDLAQLTGRQISTTSISSLSEEIREATDVSNRDVPFCYQASVSELFENKETRTFLSYSDASLKESNSNHVFLNPQMEDNVQSISKNDKIPNNEILPLPEISDELISEVFNDASFLGIESGFFDNDVRCISQNGGERRNGISAMAKTFKNNTFDFCNNRNFLVSGLFENRGERTILNYSNVYTKESNFSNHGFLDVPIEDNLQGISQNFENSHIEISPLTEVFNNENFLGMAGMSRELTDNEACSIPQSDEDPRNHIPAGKSTFNYKTSVFRDNRNFPVRSIDNKAVAGPSKTAVHSRNNDKRFLCEICKKSFAYKYTLEIHVRSHTGKKTFDCDICLKKFTHSCHLERHRRLHTGEKPFRCDFCGKHFARSDDVTRHRRIHTREKPCVSNK